MDLGISFVMHIGMISLNLRLLNVLRISHLGFRRILQQFFLGVNLKCLVLQTSMKLNSISKFFFWGGLIYGGICDLNEKCFHIVHG